MSNSFVTPWTVVHQAPLTMGFPRQEYWSGLPFPSPGDIPDPGIEPESSALQSDSSESEPQGIQQGLLYTLIKVFIKHLYSFCSNHHPPSLYCLPLPRRLRIAILTINLSNNFTGVKVSLPSNEVSSLYKFHEGRNLKFVVFPAVALSAK